MIIFSDGNDQVSVKLDEEQLKNILTKGIAIIWGLSNKGYGHGRELSAKEAEYIQKQIYNKQKVYPLSNLTNSSEKDISEYSQKILKMLENPHQK